jgi:ketosteroid isomerase-like protein
MGEDPDGTVADKYMAAMDRKDYDAFAELIHPEAVFVTGGRSFHGAAAYVEGYRKLGPILARVEPGPIVQQGDRIALAYDFVTETPVGAVRCAEFLTLRDGRIARCEFIYMNARWNEVLAVLKDSGRQTRSQESEHWVWRAA